MRYKLINNQVWSRVWDQVWDRVEDQIRELVKDQVEDRVRDQVRDHGWGQVDNQAHDHVRRQCLKKTAYEYHQRSQAEH